MIKKINASGYVGSGTYMEFVKLILQMKIPVRTHIFSALSPFQIWKAINTAYPVKAASE